LAEDTLLGIIHFGDEEPEESGPEEGEIIAIPATPVGDDEETDGLGSLPETMGVLPLSNTVVFPFLVVPLQVNRPLSIQLVDDALVGSRIIGLFTQKNAEDSNSETPDVYDVGTAVTILKMLRYPDGSMMVLVQGIARVKILEIVEKKPYPVVRVEELKVTVPEDVEIEALARNLQSQFQEIIALVPSLSDELQIALKNTNDPSKLTDFIASNLSIRVEEKQKLLSTVELRARMHRLAEILARELQIAKIGGQIQSQVQSEMGKTQREYFLREQMKAIRSELGEDEGEDLAELEERLSKAKLPVNAREAADREMNRLRRMNPSAAEYTVSRTYIEWILDIPWKKSSKDVLDLKKAAKILDEDHYDLEKVKDRILEFLAVRKLTDDNRGPILCFAGPPGVGKTSLGQSIARSMGRKFLRISLGGMHDEAEIRGHRRTYIGSLPGRIVQGLKTCGTRNPVFMLDEIDKIGSDFRGDPASALLEVLDPEQNHTFEDHYLGLPVDLSKVLFITTANVLDTIPRPLLDRMEVIRIAGYTLDDKVHIANRYLIPRVFKANGVTRRNIDLPEETIRRIAMEYTREVGLRNLERELSTVVRKVARGVAEGKKSKQVISPDRLEEFLGPAHFLNEVALRTASPGVATGMAWTQTGGDILFIEATAMPGKGNFKLTGQLGQVMNESAHAALSYLRANAKSLGVSDSFFTKYDIHIHIPAGAVPKDGPSAGVTMATALYSLMTDKPVRADVAMTGEITLRGQVLPIGGLKEKMLAAKLAGISHILMPERNRKDLSDVSDQILEGLTFHYAETISDVLAVALEKPNKAAKKTSPAKKKGVKVSRSGGSKAGGTNRKSTPAASRNTARKGAAKGKPPATKARSKKSA
jgi:ATP-dependent Lon protease